MTARYINLHFTYLLTYLLLLTDRLTDNGYQCKIKENQMDTAVAQQLQTAARDGDDGKLADSSWISGESRENGS